jgi:hypothetical protein
MPAEQYKEDSIPPIFFFKGCELFGGYKPMKPFVAHNHAPVFSAKGIKDTVCYQYPNVHDKQRRYCSYCLGLDQEPTEDECGIFGEEGYSDASEDQ